MELKEKTIYTPEQNAVLSSRGKVIVSASAGSGKTTVMIEKIVRLVCSGTDVEKILAVTYTKKAAMQMKDKLRRELIKKINDPSTSKAVKDLLKKQLAKVPSADISTIHSFCGHLIRSHFFLADVAADYYIIGEDNAEGVELKAKALETVFEKAYADAQPDFMHLLSVYFRSKKDATLKSLVLEAYDKLCKYADFQDLLKDENVRPTKAKFDAICAELLSRTKELCSELYDALCRDLEWFSAEKLKTAVEQCNRAADNLRHLLAAEDYFEMSKIPKGKMYSSISAKDGTPDGFSDHAASAEDIKKRLEGVFAELGGVRSYQEEWDDYVCAGETALKLARLVLAFDKEYAALKAEKGALDYNDLEHVALRLLRMEEVRAEMREKYSHVFVDEYQDVNPVQEQIISLVAGNELFLVGDIKQAIYGFRGSKSRYFKEKKELFEQGNGASSLLLSRNFRSAGGVLDCVNEEFSFAMTPSVSEVDYQKDSVMDGGDRYLPDKGKVLIHYLPKTEKVDEEDTRGVYSVEENYLNNKTEISEYGKRVAEIIRRAHNSTWYDADKQQTRRVEYGDIVVLSRKRAGRVSEVVEALAAEGVPVTSESKVNVCSYPEVKMLTDVLSYLDNPEQDIPLCSCLLSPLAGLTADDLAAIRLAYPAEHFFRVCCKKYAKGEGELAQKLQSFFEYIKALRTLSSVMTAGEVLAKILLDSHLEATLLAKDGGDQALRRVRFFLAQTTQATPLTVHEFLDFLAAVDFKVNMSVSGGENAVRVMTMHASKGLEFPVVILDDLSATFEGQDNFELRFDEEHIFALKCYRKENMSVRPTLLWLLCGKRQRDEDVKNELNLFYVATTRAQYALHMVFSKLPSSPNVKYAKSYADFVDFGKWGKYLQNEEQIELPQTEKTALVGKTDPELVEKLFAELERTYPFGGVENLPVKGSASQRMRADGEQEYYHVPVLFDEETETETRTDRDTGVAYHAFLELFDFHGFGQVDTAERDAFVEAELFRILPLLSERSKELLNKDKLLEILKNPVFEKIGKMRLYREQEFLAELSAAEAYGEKYPATEKGIFQGVPDVLAIGEDGGVWIVDYKFSSGGAAYLKEKYAVQLDLYKKVTAKILRVQEEKIRATIVNINRGFEVEI